MGNHRVSELVRQDAFEQLGVIQRAADGHANSAIVLSARPLGRARDVAKLLLGIENRHECTGGIFAEPVTNRTKSEMKHVRRLARQLFLLATLEHDSELVVAAFVERAVHVVVAAPAVQLAREPGVARRIFQGILVRANREIDIAFGICDAAQQSGRGRQARVQFQRAL